MTPTTRIRPDQQRAPDEDLRDDGKSHARSTLDRLIQQQDNPVERAYLNLARTVITGKRNFSKPDS